MKLDNFNHLEYSNNCLHFHCYIDNVFADVSFDLLKVFHVEREAFGWEVLLSEIILTLQVQSQIQVKNKEYLFVWIF